jgi:hypothetical protein
MSKDRDPRPPEIAAATRKARQLRHRRRQEAENRRMQGPEARDNHRAYTTIESVAGRLSIHDGTILDLLDRIAKRAAPALAADIKVVCRWVEEDAPRVVSDLRELSAADLQYLTE